MGEVGGKGVFGHCWCVTCGPLCCGAGSLEGVGGSRRSRKCTLEISRLGRCPQALPRLCTSRWTALPQLTTYTRTQHHNVLPTMHPGRLAACENDTVNPATSQTPSRPPFRTTTNPKVHPPAPPHHPNGALTPNRSLTTLTRTPTRPILLTSPTAPVADDTPISALRPLSNPAQTLIQVRGAKRDTFNPSHRVRKRRHGFLARLRTRTGRKVLARRKAKGRNTLSH